MSEEVVDLETESAAATLESVATEPVAATLEAVSTNTPEPGPTATATADDEIHGAALDLILQVAVTLSMEVGRTRMSIGDLLQLGPGSIVELDRLAGSPMDVLVNGTLIGQGEVVVVNDKFGIRMTDVASARERVRSVR